MKIPGTPRRMEEFIKAIQASSVSADTYSRILAAAATELADAIPAPLGDDIDWDEFRADCVHSAKSKPKILETTYDNYVKTTIDPETMYIINDSSSSIWTSKKIEPQAQARLTPALCSCCGGRIGKDNYCEYCGTRYW